MNDTLRLGRTLLVCATVAFMWACDDTAPGTTADTGMGGTGGTPDDMGGGDTGGTGGTPDTQCLRDSQCADDEYCDVPEGEMVGLCEEGCRPGEDGECPEGEACDPVSHMCVAEPCAGDDACPEGEYCAPDGSCQTGCREDAGCEEADDFGRGQVCDTAADPRVCVPLFPCCMVDECSESVAATCENDGGEVIDGVATCGSNPCGPTCATDEECPNGQYCNTEDGRCADGCRVDDPETCQPSEICDPEKHTCEPLRCIGDDDCPDDRFCDPDQNLCLPGCREEPDNCGEGEQCVERECVSRCDPRAPEGDPNGCLAGSYCDPFTFNCLEECGEHDDCDADRYCEPDSGRCIPGCRDDEGELGEPNNEPAEATPVDLVPGEDGVRIGRAEGRIICGNDPDFYVVELEAGERLRVDLIYERDAGNLNLTLSGDEIDGEGITADTLEVPERLEFPPLGETIQRPATYYIEVFPAGNDPLRRMEYEIVVSVVDALVQCFPDGAEPDDNERDGATVVDERGGAYVRNICPGDVDYFAIDMLPNDGFDAVLRLDPPDAQVEAYIFPANRNAANAPYRLVAADGFRFSAELDDGAFAPAGPWFVQVRGLDGDVVADYELEIVREPSGQCGNDSNTEPNDDGFLLEEEVPLDAPFTIDFETEICTVDNPDVDTFCFQVEEGETVEGWATTRPDAVNGELSIQLLDGRGVLVGNAGRSTLEGEITDPARSVNLPAGNVCVRVSGVDGAQGPYSLTVQRTAPAGGVCENDVAEANGRNDIPRAPTELTDVAGDGTRWENFEGYICDPEGGVDEDWYRFEVAEAGSSLCVLVDSFDRNRADVDLDVFPGQGDAAGGACNANCRGACIDGRCTPPYEVSDNANYDFEMVNLRRPFVGQRQGPFLLRVRHNDEDEGPYNVTVTVTPTGDECLADWRERDGANDGPENATFLGAGHVAACDTWVCGDERRTGDWYAIDMAAGQDRTVIINYSNPVEGRLDLNVIGPDQPDDIGSGSVSGFLGAGNHQCVNLRATDNEASVLIQVLASQFNDDQRIDYSLRVVPTDLDENPEGECELLGAADFPACAPRDEWDEFPGLGKLQPEDCWATAVLP